MVPYTDRYFREDDNPSDEYKPNMLFPKKGSENYAIVLLIGNSFVCEPRVSSAIDPDAEKGKAFRYEPWYRTQPTGGLLSPFGEYKPKNVVVNHLLL